VHPEQLSSLTKYQMDKKLDFGTNILSKDPDNGNSRISLHDPHFCNTMLAVMQVLYASGAADVFDQLGDIEKHSGFLSILTEGCMQDFDAARHVRRPTSNRSPNDSTRRYSVAQIDIAVNVSCAGFQCWSSLATHGFLH
jgi:hypothetical protein